MRMHRWSKIALILILLFSSKIASCNCRTSGFHVFLGGGDVQAAVREDRGEGGLTSSSATSNRQKRKRGGIDPTQAAGTAAVGDTANGVGQSRSSTDMEGIAKRDPDNAVR